MKRKGLVATHAYFLAPFGAIALSACASDGGRYPSLEIRDVERVSGAFEPVPPATETLPPADISADVAAQISAARAAAGAAHDNFLTALPRTARLVSAGRNSSVASDSWASAQVALSGLESIRSEVAISLADIDSLYVDARTQAAPLGNIERVRSEIIGFIVAEDTALSDLRGQMARR